MRMGEEWRADMLEFMPYLRSQSFVRKPYKAYRPGWEHDHCVVCTVTFVELSIHGDDIIHEGYAITSDYVHGDDYAWVCDECFAACKALMDWKDVTAG